MRDMLLLLSNTIGGTDHPSNFHPFIMRRLASDSAKNGSLLLQFELFTRALERNGYLAGNIDNAIVNQIHGNHQGSKDHGGGSREVRRALLFGWIFNRRHTKF